MPNNVISENKIIEISGNRMTKEQAQQLINYLHLREPELPSIYDRVCGLLDKHNNKE